jgi:hypothetical protein
VKGATLFAVWVYLNGVPVLAILDTGAPLPDDNYVTIER